MLKYISSFFGGDSGTDLSLDEAYNVLDRAKDKSEELLNAAEEDVEPTEYSCFQKSGIITSAKNNGHYTIDDIYEFQSDASNFTIGTRVSFTVFDSAGKIKVSNLSILDDWCCNESDLKSSWCIRSYICKVTKREGRTIFVTPGDLSINLNDVASEFIPIAGDWVDVEGKVMLDEDVTDLFGKVLEIQKIRPLRPHILQGKIKEWCSKSKIGCIDRGVFFNQDALAAGYMPAIGDKVTTQVIESQQGVCTFRALKVLPEYSKSELNNFSTFEFDVENNCVYITEDIIINGKTMGERREIAFDVVNKSNESVFLVSVTVETNSAQCIFKKPESVGNIEITPSQHMRIEGICTLKNVGITRELILFTFTHCKIGRWITVNLEMHQAGIQKASSSDRRSSLLGVTKFRTDNTLIRGQRAVVPPRFISARLPDYPVPKKLMDLILKYQDSTKSIHILQELYSFKPCLNLPLSYNIYEDYFHTLIHLEEIYQILAIRIYACDLTCFVRNNEYLMLEIENLSERRPSLMTGDRIIAKDPYNPNSDEFEGFIHKVGAKHVYIKFASSFHATYNGEDVSVMAIASRSVFRRMHQAVGLAVRNLGNAFLFPSKIESRKAQVMFVFDAYTNVLQETNLIDTNRLENSADSITPKTNQIIKTDSSEDPKEVSPKSQLLLEPVEDGPKKKQRYPDQFEQKIHKLEWYNKNLNYYQKEAVRNILIGEARPLPYLIFGPPGTGKTVTLVEAILQILRLIPQSRILVATPSNSAADLIALRLIDSGLLKPGDLIRLVAYRCVVENMLPLKLIPYCATADIAKEGTAEHPFPTSNKALTVGCNSSVIGRHRITVGTCSTLGNLFSMGFSKGHFTHIIVDEAAQTTEPEILIPLALLDVSSGQVIFAGDPLQLGPVICSKEAAACGLEETFLDRLLNRFPYVRDPEGFPQSGGYDPRLVTRLLYNYRSLPQLLSLTSDLFYNGELVPTISPIDSAEACLLKQVDEILPLGRTELPPAILFHGVVGENCQASDCPSWFNPNEASQVFFYVNELYRLGLKSSDIGIISPYSKQVRQIRALLVEAEFDVPKVGTVEEFQGQEFPVIVISTVRSNENLVTHDLNYKLGFLSHSKRVNVAISRARALLIIIGDPQLLCTDKHWRSVIKYCVDSASYCGCELPVLGK